MCLSLNFQKMVILQENDSLIWTELPTIHLFLNLNSMMAKSFLVNWFSIARNNIVILWSVDADGVPLDGSPTIVVRTFQIELVVVFYILTTVGIAFAVGCLLFNFIYRERK